MHHDTEDARRALIDDMPAELMDRVNSGEQVWTTEQMRDDFTVLGFQAPFVVVTRKADGARGSLMFTHQPRFYFAWQPDDTGK
jgi:hypothetical protein